MLDAEPRLYGIRTNAIQRFKDNGIDILSAKHADPTNILPELRKLQKSIKSAEEFDDELSCISHYLTLIKSIFKKTHALGDSSMDFHIYFGMPTGYYFEHILNTY